MSQMPAQFINFQQQMFCFPDELFISVSCDEQLILLKRQEFQGTFPRV